MMPSEASPLVGGATVTSGHLFVNYVLFGLAFGCAYGSLKASTAYLSSLFPKEIASTGNAFQYGVWMLSSLFLAAALTQAIGSKRTLALAQGTVAVYQLMLLVASCVGPETSVATALVWASGALAGTLARVECAAA